MKRFTDTQDTGARGTPQLHQKSTLEGKPRGHRQETPVDPPTIPGRSGLLHTGYPEEGGADVSAQGTPYASAPRNGRA